MLASGLGGMVQTCFNKKRPVREKTSWAGLSNYNFSRWIMFLKVLDISLHQWLVSLQNQYVFRVLLLRRFCEVETSGWTTPAEVWLLSWKNLKKTGASNNVGLPEEIVLVVVDSAVFLPEWFVRAGMILSEFFRGVNCGLWMSLNRWWGKIPGTWTACRGRMIYKFCVNGI